MILWIYTVFLGDCLYPHFLLFVPSLYVGTQSRALKLGDILNTLNQQFSQKLQQLEQALNLCNDLFSTSSNWQNLTDEERLRFAFFVMKAFQKI
jgi:hypothetical protein